MNIDKRAIGRWFRAHPRARKAVLVFLVAPFVFGLWLFLVIGTAWNLAGELAQEYWEMWQ
jgi:hypothetical protein